MLNDILSQETHRDEHDKDLLKDHYKQIQNILAQGPNNFDDTFKEQDRIETLQDSDVNDLGNGLMSKSMSQEKLLMVSSYKKTEYSSQIDRRYVNTE